jgi:hypothetical protein
MALPNPDHDPPHRGPETGQSVDTIDQTSSIYVLGLAAAGAMAISAIHLVVG